MKILVISLAGIGDTLIATPLIHELRLLWPEAVIDAFVLSPGSRGLLEGNPHLNAIHQLDPVKEGVGRTMAYLRQLRQGRYDLSINTHPQSRIAYRVFARVIGAPVRVSHLYDHSTWFDRLLISRLVPQDYAVHSVENNLRLLGCLQKKPQLPSHRYEIYLGLSEQEWASEFMQVHPRGEKLLGIHVGSGETKNLSLKRWPLELYIELLGALLRDHPGLNVLLFGGPGEAAAHAEMQRRLLSPQIRIPKTRNLRQAAALLQHCDGFLSVDTVFMHLAAAMRVPHQIVIEAPTLNPTNVPYANPYRLVVNPAVHGRNLNYYRYDGGPIKGTEEELVRSMRAVTVPAVYDAVVDELGLAGARASSSS